MGYTVLCVYCDHCLSSLVGQLSVGKWDEWVICGFLLGLHYRAIGNCEEVAMGIRVGTVIIQISLETFSKCIIINNEILPKSIKGFV